MSLSLPFPAFDFMQKWIIYVSLIIKIIEEAPGQHFYNSLGYHTVQNAMNRLQKIKEIKDR